MSIAETMIRFFSSRDPSRNEWNIGGRGATGSGWERANHSSMPATNSASRSRRFSCVTRRLRVTMLKANCSGSWCT